MSLIVAILLAWLVGLPSAVVLYAALSHRWHDFRLARRERSRRPAPVVSIAAAQRSRASRAAQLSA
jgi:hypothetical protein